MMCLLCSEGERPSRSFSRYRFVRSVLRRGGFFARLGLVDLERLSVHIAAVEAGDRGIAFFGGAELDEAEALGRAADPLGGDVRRDELAVRRGEVGELRGADLFGEISYVQFHFEAPAGRAGPSLA